MMDSPGDYGFGGGSLELSESPAPRHPLRHRYGLDRRGSPAPSDQRHGLGTRRSFSIGASFLQDFAANRPGFRVPVWSWPGKGSPRKGA